MDLDEAKSGGSVVHWHLHTRVASTRYDPAGLKRNLWS
jgi:hypothetical protein